MANGARLPIVASRVGACVRTMLFHGADLTGCSLELQARIAGDAPGAPLLDLTIAAAGTEGISIGAVTRDANGVPTTPVVIRIAEATMKNAAKIPYMGELGDPCVLAYDLVGWGGALGPDKRLLVYGDLVALASVNGADNAPTGRVTGCQRIGAWAGANTASVSLDDGTIAQVSIDGADLLGSYLVQTQAARDGANVAVLAAQKSSAAASSASQSALLYRDTTAQAASTALAALAASPNGQYLTISAGLAATAPNGFFYVASGGDVFTTLYQKVNGNAVLINALPSSGAIDRIGHYFAGAANVDNAPTINAVLAQALISGVILPPTDIRIDDAIFVPIGRFLRGAGRGVTRLIRTDNIASYSNSDAQHKSVVIAPPGATAVRISDFDAVAPKLAKGSTLKCNAVWIEAADSALVERVRAYNAGYSFWSRGAYDTTFRDVQSFNGNVHFETTNSHRVLFEGFQSGDGDGDNTLGCEAHCHTLYDSTSVTFRNGVTSGKGQPVLIVNDGVSLIDDINVENVRSVSPTGTVMIFLQDNQNGKLGRINVKDSDFRGDPAMPGLIMQINASSGTCVVRNTGLRGYASASVQVGVGATLRLVDSNVTVSVAKDDDGGSVLTGLGNQAPAGTIIVERGGLTVTAGKSVKLTNVPTCAVSKETGVSHANRFVAPVAVNGQTIVTTDADLPQGPSQYLILPDGSRAYFYAPTDAPIRLRVQWRGRLSKTGGNGNLSIGSDADARIRLYGGIRIEQADGTMLVVKGMSAAVPASNGDVREFDVDFSVLASGVGIGFGGGATLLAGSEITVTRLS